MKKYNLLIDLSSLIYPIFFINGVKLNLKYEEDREIFKEILFKNIFKNINFFKNKFNIDKIIFAIDSRNSWRKNFFIEYKQNRKETRIIFREKLKFFYEIIDEIITILDKIFIVLKIENAEADDIIAVLVKEFQNENFILVSNDKDFKQLLFFENIRYFNIKNLKEEKCKNPILFLKEHILKGDNSDGIPNILSDDDVFIDFNKRQKPLRRKMLDFLLKLNENELLNFLIDKKKYKRNKKMIDLIHDEIPQEIKNNIINEYITQKNKKINFLKFIKYLQRRKIFYLIKNFL